MKKKVTNMTKLKNTDEKWIDTGKATQDAICTEHGKQGCFHKLPSNPEKQRDDWEREFRKRFVRQPAHDMILVVADVEPVIDFIRQVEKQTRDDVIEEIRRWTKGKDVTKDKLRNHLNQLKQKTKE